MTHSSIDIGHLKTWEGRRQSGFDRITAFPANALAATLDRDDPVYEVGAVLPPVWHWLYFLPVFKRSEANYDGHAALGDFLPPVPLPRRMWAGSRLTFHAPLRIGQQAEKESEVVSVDHKPGKSGDLVFVTLRHRISAEGALCIEEEHDIVYRGAPAPDAPAVTLRPAPESARASRRILPDPVLLFRYSALTFNGHRIHYDQPFCRSEGYEGLVVHGPLLATLMLDLLRREPPDAAVAAFRFRAVAPVFDTTAFDVQTDGGGRVWIRRADGALAMDGEVMFSD